MRKRDENSDLLSPGGKLYPHEEIANPEILDQFTVSYSHKRKNSIWRLYFRSNRVEIHRNLLNQESGSVFEVIVYDDLDSIQIERYGSYFEGDLLFFPDYFHGVMKFVHKPGTKYYEEPPKDDKETVRTPYIPIPSEVWFDMKYNDLIRQHISKIQDIFYDFKHGQAGRNNGPGFNIYNVDTGGGNANINSHNNSHNTNIDNSIINISQRVMNETDGSERDEMFQILYEIQQLIKEMKDTGTISSERKGRIAKIGDHLKRHDWFYKEIVPIVGSAVLKYIFGA